MTEENIKKLNEAIERLYSNYVSKPLRILEIFNEFFGEEFVDLQNLVSYEEFSSIFINSTPYELLLNCNASTTTLIKNLPDKDLEEFLNKIETVHFISTLNPYILVHFPRVRVTNENNRFIDITHLYAKITITYGGLMVGKFSLNRSEYTAMQMLSGYMHSHISGIPSSDFSQFQDPCLGSGPIRDTISSLRCSYNEDLWELFCLELSKYVTVESLTGIPYRQLESVGAASTCPTKFYIPSSIYRLYKSVTELFLPYFIASKKLKFSYKNGFYTIGMSYIDFILCISNEFIAWYNEQISKGTDNLPTINNLFNNNYIDKYIISNNTIYKPGNYNVSSLRNYEGKFVCRFKNRDVKIHITDYEDVNANNTTILLSSNIALFMLNSILKVLNYKYGRKTNSNDSDASEGQTNPKVRFL
jgi:hypothetical protein